MNEEEKKLLKDFGFANVVQLALAYVGLQQENYQLAEKVINQRHALCDTNKKIQVLNARIEKAIEYIENWNCFECDKGTMREISLSSSKEDIRQILKGEENEKRN